MALAIVASPSFVQPFPGRRLYAAGQLAAHDRSPAMPGGLSLRFLITAGGAGKDRGRGGKAGGLSATNEEGACRMAAAL